MHVFLLDRIYRPALARRDSNIIPAQHTAGFWGYALSSLKPGLGQGLSGYFMPFRKKGKNSNPSSRDVEIVEHSKRESTISVLRAVQATRQHRFPAKRDCISLLSSGKWWKQKNLYPVKSSWQLSAQLTDRIWYQLYKVRLPVRSLFNRGNKSCQSCRKKRTFSLPIW